MIEITKTILPLAGITSHVLLGLLLAAVLFRRSWGRKIFSFVGKNAIFLGFLVSLAAVGGSLFYSEVVGFEACALCWWQRVFIYPQAVLFAVALWAKEKSVFLYSVPLSILAGIVALYHSYVYVGGTSILSCTALGGACSKVYVMEFGYITIPSLSLTIVLYLLLLAWVNRLYKNESR